MKIEKAIWIKLIEVEKQFRQRGETLTRKKIIELFNVSDPHARQLIFALKNKHIIAHTPTKITPQANKCLVIADAHVPMHDIIAYSAMMEYAIVYDPDMLILLGDFLDFKGISFFRDSKKLNNYLPSEEIETAKNELIKLCEKLPNLKTKIYYEGNHERRLQNYILDNSPKISDLLENILIEKLELEKLGFEYIREPFQIGDIWFLHGDEKPRGGGNPEYITNVIFKYVLDNFMCGHYHRTQDKVWKRIDGNIFMGCCVGTLGQMNPSYARLNRWNHGFATIDFRDNGNFSIDNKKIFDGNIY